MCAFLAFLAPTLSIRHIFYSSVSRNAFHMHGFYSNIYIFFKMHSEVKNNYIFTHASVRQKGLVVLSLSKLRHQHIPEGKYLFQMYRKVFPSHLRNELNRYKLCPQCILKHNSTRLLDTQPCREGPWATWEQNWFRGQCFPVKPTFHFRTEKSRKAGLHKVPGHLIKVFVHSNFSSGKEVTRRTNKIHLGDRFSMKKAKSAE